MEFNYHPILGLQYNYDEFFKPITLKEISHKVSTKQGFLELFREHSLLAASCYIGLDIFTEIKSNSRL